MVCGMTCGNPKCQKCYPRQREYYQAQEPSVTDMEPNAICPIKPTPSNIQTHVHEFAGSTMFAGSITHNHRFAGVTSEMIPVGDSHVHAILVNTDFFFNHFHEVGIRTGLPIIIEGEKHVHYVEGETTTNFNHDHDFEFVTFLQNPLQEDPA